MPQYRSDSREEIQLIFAQEGENLRRAGFNEPDLSEQPAGFEGVEGSSKQPFDTAREAARLGIDLEVAHQG